MMLIGVKVLVFLAVGSTCILTPCTAKLQSVTVEHLTFVVFLT